MIYKPILKINSNWYISIESISGHTYNERISSILAKHPVSLVEANEINVFTSRATIVAIGDSLTEGVGDETNQGGYIQPLNRKINKNHQTASFYNFGKRGNRTDQLLQRLDQSEITSALSHANTVLITIGANDIMQVFKENFINLTYEQFAKEQVNFERNLKGIYEKIRTHNAYAQIFFVGLYNPFYQHFGNIKELEQIVNEWNVSIQKVSNETVGTTFIPIKDLFANTDENVFAEDHFHPNKRGYERMAERIFEYLSRER